MVLGFGRAVRATGPCYGEMEAIKEGSRTGLGSGTAMWLHRVFLVATAVHR